MKHHYSDIRDRIHEPPTWFDEHGAPRYCAFDPDETSEVCADEVVLLRVRCQNCGQAFDVCMTWDAIDGYRGHTRLSALVEMRKIHYGDPPNVACCPSGPTMNSVPMHVLEFWRRASFNPEAPTAPMWERVPSLEVDVLPDWAKEGT